MLLLLNNQPRKAKSRLLLGGFSYLIHHQAPKCKLPKYQNMLAGQSMLVGQPFVTCIL